MHWLHLFCVCHHNKSLAMEAGVRVHARAGLCASKDTHITAQPRPSLSASWI